MATDVMGQGFWKPLRLAAWGGAAGLILLPLLAMQLTTQVDWEASDYRFAVGLVVGLGLAFEFAARRTGKRAYRAGIGIALAAGLLLAWINLAVGIIGSENNPANYIYFAVIGVAVAGAVLARLRPAGMAVAMAAAAVAQVLAAIYAVVAGFGFTGPITIFFAGLWLISAWLFHKAKA